MRSASRRRVSDSSHNPPGCGTEGKRVYKSLGAAFRDRWPVPSPTKVSDNLRRMRRERKEIDKSEKRRSERCGPPICYSGRMGSMAGEKTSKIARTVDK